MKVLTGQMVVAVLDYPVMLRLTFLEVNEKQTVPQNDAAYKGQCFYLIFLTVLLTTERKRKVE